MNTSIIRYVLGYVLKTEAAFMLIPSLVALIYREPAGVAYLIVAVLCFALGMLATIKKPARPNFYLKEGCVATGLSWIVLSLMGALPFVISGEIPSYTNALFETLPEQVSLPMLKYFRTATCSGEALRTGSAAWEFLFSFLLSSRLAVRPISIL